MGKYVCWQVPYKYVDGTYEWEWMNDLIMSEEKNSSSVLECSGFATVIAKDAGEARKKYFYGVYVPKLREDEKDAGWGDLTKAVYMSTVVQYVYRVLQDYDEDNFHELEAELGKNDAAIIWEIALSYSEKFPDNNEGWIAWEDSIDCINPNTWHREEFWDARINALSSDSIEKLLFWNERYNICVANIEYEIK